jgi:hypothetical protein
MGIVSRVSLVLALVGGAAAAAERPTRARAGAEQGVIDPRADAALRRMGSYLGGLSSFRVDTTTVDEQFTNDGQKIQSLRSSQVTVKRPNQLAVDRIGPAGKVAFRYDGKRFTIFVAQKNVWASAPAPANLDEAIDMARDQLGIDAPGGDLMVADPYESLIDGVKVGRYIGLEPIDGVMAHHLAMTKDTVDWQIWIQDGPQPVPLRYVITSKDLPGKPQFTAQLSHWQPNTPVANSTFAFSPPANAQKVEWSALQKRAAQRKEQQQEQQQ